MCPDVFRDDPAIALSLFLTLTQNTITPLIGRGLLPLAVTSLKARAGVKIASGSWLVLGLDLSPASNWSWLVLGLDLSPASNWSWLVLGLDLSPASNW